MKRNHCHSQYEIYYLLSGDRNYFIQDRVYNINRGDLVLIHPHILHKTLDSTTSFHERILIEFNVNFLSGFLVDHHTSQLLEALHTDKYILHPEEPEKKQFENCLSKILRESNENKIENNIALKVYFLELLVLINKFHAKANTLDLAYPSRLHKRISEIIAYINLNYMYDIGLNMVADKFFISSAHLCRAFKKVTGFTFVEYINNLRIREAQKLLDETALNISEIAKIVGFQSNTHFGRVFKSITGNTPREYRNLL